MTFTKIMQALVGSRKAHIENLIVAALMLGVTSAYELISRHFIPDFSINWFEFVGTWAGLVCVWLSRTQNILAGHGGL